jgi:hypothetical protein
MGMGRPEKADRGRWSLYRLLDLKRTLQLSGDNEIKSNTELCNI